MISDLLEPLTGSWALPLLVVAPLLLAAALPRAAGARGAVAAAGVALAAAVAALVLGLTGPLPGSCLVFATAVVLVTTAFSARHLDGDPAAPGYRRAFLLTAAGAVAVLAAPDLLVIAGGWLLAGRGTLRLVGHHAGLAATDQAVRALRRAGRVGDLALLVAVGCWAWPAGSTAVPAVTAHVAADPTAPAAVAGALALLVAVVARCALMPFHRWLPASVVAPAPVSALLHAGIVNGPVLVLVTTAPAWSALGWFGPALVAVGLGTSVLTFPRLLVRPDVKGRLAWSTVAQIGFMVALVGIGAHAAAVLHLMLHGLYKANAFLRAGEHLSRARQDAPQPGSRRAALAGAAAGALVGLAAVIVDRGWEQPLLAAVVLVAATAAGQGLLSLQARWTTRLAAALVAAAALAGVLALPRLAAGWWQTPPAPAGPAAWAGAAVVGLLAVTGAWALTRRPVAAWALLHRSADPLVGSSQAVTASLLRRLRPASSAAVAPVADGDRAADDDRAAVRAAVAAAAEALPPAWSWRAFVAANPLWGSRDLDLDAAVALDRARRAAAARAAAQDPGVDHVVAGWLAAWTCTTPLPWPAPGRDLPLWQWLRTVAVTDPLLRAAGPLPVLPERAIDLLAARWHGDGDLRARAETELLRLPGWSAYLARRSTTAAQVDVDVLVDLLAAREVARALAGPALNLLPASALRPAVAAGEPAPAADGAVDDAEVAAAPSGITVAALEPHEAALRDALLPALAHRAGRASSARSAAGRSTGGAADADLVFCIDVRSEPLRRHLERHGRYRTIGFAGFFGLPVLRRNASGRTSDRLPALLAPAVTVTAPARPAGVAELLRAGLQRALDTPGGGFAAVEAAGVTGLGGLLAATRAWPDALRRRGSALQAATAAGFADGVDRAAAVQAAVGLVRATGLAQDPAPLVVLVGHGSTSANNPAEAAFDCGACGGHRGGLNARLAAELLNAADTRAALAAAGLRLPGTTVVLAAEHDTATDTVHLVDPSPALMAGPVARDALARLQAALAAAGAATAQERCPDLPLAGAGRARSARAGSARAAAREVRRRSADPSEVRHEWGLAGNAFFIAGPRSLTRGLDLAGRAFLHEYDPATDPGDTGLETILTAPLVVAHWINAQYLFSTHDPLGHGAGSKTAHNPVGGLGVLNGPCGDLCTGLTEQSVRHGAGPFREQTRLLAVVVADPARIDAVLRRHPDVEALVTGRWLQLAALHPDTGRVAVRDAAGWHPYAPQTTIPTREHGGSHDLDPRDPRRPDLAGAGRP